jgi:hypothetical protein
MGLCLLLIAGMSVGVHVTMPGTAIGTVTNVTLITSLDMYTLEPEYELRILYIYRVDATVHKLTTSLWPDSATQANVAYSLMLRCLNTTTCDTVDISYDVDNPADASMYEKFCSVRHGLFIGGLAVALIAFIISCSFFFAMPNGCV